MVKFSYDGKEGYIDKGLKFVLDRKIANVKKDDDLVIAITGAERAGKSEFAKNTVAPYIASELKTKYGLDNIHFTINDYMRSSLKGDINQINVNDEARKELNRSKSISKSNTNFMNYLSECGDMNQIHLILLPSHIDLDAYLIDWRLDLLIVIGKKLDKDTGIEQRGFFKIINTKKKLFKQLYFKKQRTIPSSLVVMYGRFTKNAFIDESTYKNKKGQNRLEKYVEMDEPNKPKPLTPRQIEVLAKVSPAKVFKKGEKDYEVLQKLTGSLRKLRSGESR